jgi:antitoxin Phd
MKSLTRHSQKSLRSTSGSRWQLQTAKARFSEVFRRARSEGPQYVTKAGKEAVVIIPAEEFERLTECRHQPKNLVDFFRNSPLVGADVDLGREPDYGREFEL